MPVMAVTVPSGEVLTMSSGQDPEGPVSFYVLALFLPKSKQTIGNRVDRGLKQSINQAKTKADFIHFIQ
jgi:hypothetical protein